MGKMYFIKENWQQTCKSKQFTKREQQNFNNSPD